MPSPHKRERKVKAWVVFNPLTGHIQPWPNGGELLVWATKKKAQAAARLLFSESIVPCTITYKLPPPPKHG